MKGGEEAAGAEHDGADRQHGASLVHPVKVAPRHVRHANRPRRAVHELVAVPGRERKAQSRERERERERFQILKRSGSMYACKYCIG